jgi:methionyl aminopeptidase
MIEFKSPRQIAIMREANLIVRDVLDELIAAARPGVSTEELDALAAQALVRSRAESAFLGYRGYPKVLCASVNHQVVHGIPSRHTVLKDGDVLSLDFGVVYKGYVGDAARTITIGEVSPEAKRLIEVTRTCLDRAIEQMVPGRRLSDIGRTVQGYAEGQGYSVVRDFVGHGIGRVMHEDPQVPNYWDGTSRDHRLRPGMVLAVEPMVNMGDPQVRILDDDWTVETVDGSLSAHFEDSIAITKDGPLVLSR